MTPPSETELREWVRQFRRAVGPSNAKGANFEMALAAYVGARLQVRQESHALQLRLAHLSEQQQALISFGFVAKPDDYED